MNKESILKELKELVARLEGMIHCLEMEETDVETTVGEVRKRAILEEIYRLGGKVTPRQISDLARKYGRDPRACSGYYRNNGASLRTDATRKFRELTDIGKQSVINARAAWGQDWLDHIPLDIVSSPCADEAKISF